MLKIMLPKSLDSDSAKGVTFITPPVPIIAEALFNDAIEHITICPAATRSSLRVSGFGNLPLCLSHLWYYIRSITTII